MLTPDQRECGKAFRDWCRDALLNGITADAFCPPYLTWYRHECAPGDRAVQSGTWAMKLKQSYVRLGTACEEHGVPEGMFAYVFYFGMCPRCDLRVRSGSGRFVIASETPPDKGAIVGEQPAHGKVPAGQAGHAHAPGVDG